MEIATTPVVINEIAWMGTAADANDEWIELYNPTGEDISLDGWVLYATDGVPEIALENTISAGGYYLIERTDDTTVSDIAADLVTPFSGSGAGAGLGNTPGGETLTLARVANGATTTIDQAVNWGSCAPASSCGDNVAKKTMERYDPLALGIDEDNWATALGEFIKNGEDANGDPLKGTPKAKNSVSYLIALGGALDEDKTLTAAGSPYLVDRAGLVVESGATLTLEAGAVVKIVTPQEPHIGVAGNIVAQGTALNPVVFTSFRDDDYGGDMNGDGSTSSPQADDWTHIVIESTSAGSSFENTLVRYAGGSKAGYVEEAGVLVDGASPSFDAITIEYSNNHGLYLDGSSSTVTNSIFAYNDGVNAAGIYVDGVPGGAPSLTGNTFTENYFGVYAQAASALTASGNTFTDNTNAAVHVSGLIGSFSGNTGTGNAPNAIAVGYNGNITLAGAMTTLSANTLPYFVEQEARVAASSTLAIADGVVIKGHDNSGNIAGKIVVKPGASMTSSGSVPSSIVFTSENDDTAGGDTNGDGDTVLPAAGDWYGIVVENGGFLDMVGFTIAYAGGNVSANGDDRGGIKISGDVAASTISNALFDSNYQYGVHVKQGGALTVSNATFQNHTNGKTVNYSAVFGWDSATITLSDITFVNNTNLDIRGVAPYTISCTNCGAPVTDPDPL